MRVAAIGSWLVVCFALVGCDSKEEPDLGIPKTKSAFDLKQSSDSKMSQEELEEARRKAGFKSHEEQVAEAKAAYDTMEKGYVKGRLDAYRDLLGKLRKELGAIEKAAPKWAKAKDPQAAHAKFDDKYKEAKKAFLDEYNALTENGSRGGNLQVELDRAVKGWEGLVGELGPEITADDKLATMLGELRTQIETVEKELEAIEKDESIEAEEVEETGEKKKE